MTRAAMVAAAMASRAAMEVAAIRRSAVCSSQAASSACPGLHVASRVPSQQWAAHLG